MAETFKVELALVTRYAKQAMRRLQSAKAKVGATEKTKRAAKTSRQAKATFGFLGGWGAVNRATRKMRGGAEQADPWTGAMVPMIAATQAAVDSATGFSVKARRQARADTVAMLADNVGAGASIGSAKTVFNIRNNIRQQEEKGRNIVRQTVTGPTLDDLVESAAKGYFELSGKAWAYIWDKVFG